jgi:hypothetical protein
VSIVAGLTRKAIALSSDSFFHLENPGLPDSDLKKAQSKNRALQG